MTTITFPPLTTHYQTHRGDALITSQAATVYASKKTTVPKGIAFPTSISINNVVSHFSPMPSDKDVPTLKDGDVVKVMMGVHIDGVSWPRRAMSDEGGVSVGLRCKG
jgi:methionine aminopeptidase